MQLFTISLRSRNNYSNMSWRTHNEGINEVNILPLLCVYIEYKEILLILTYCL